MKKIYQRAMAVALAGTTLLGAGLWHHHYRISPAPSKQVTKNADALPTGVSEATLADIRSSLEKQEYHISFDEQKKKLQSPNRRNNIRAYYEPGKLTVQTRVDTTGEGFKMELVNEGVFADGKLLYTPELGAKAAHHENKVQISHSAFTEEFINNEDGVRQNFIIQDAPEGTRELQVKMTPKGLKVQQGSGNELRFYTETANGKTRNELVYSDLKCWDANKKPLNATLAYVDNRVQISVDVAGASYPVTIDPIIANGTPQNANKILQIDQSYMHLGFSVSSAGDVNGDGYSDVIVGAPDYDYNKDAEGGAFVYKGDPSGLTLTAVAFKSNQIGARMGYSVASAGDFNGDGFSDVIVGIPFYDGDAVDCGKANLYLGSSTFFSSAITAYAFGNDHEGALIGINVATAGDIDADGYSDVLIGGHQDSMGESKEGTVAVCKGSANGNLYSAFSYLQINQANASFGYSIAPAGDVDADGYSDIIVGARYYTNGQGQDAEGAAFIYRGGSNGLQGNPTIIEGNQYNAAMGYKVSSAGDVNGDGYSDILIGCYTFDNGQTDEGHVFVYHGGASGIGFHESVTVSNSKASAQMGFSVAGAGDVNGDGYGDIIVGAPYYDEGQSSEGVAIVYYGSGEGLVTNTCQLLQKDQANSYFGGSVAGAGDVNGDGYDDVIVGAKEFTLGQNNEGVVFIYLGSSTGINTNIITWYVHGNKADSDFGFAVAGAGDINRDGYADFLVGAPSYSNVGNVFVFYGSQLPPANPVNISGSKFNSHFGEAIASAGDVNGDGYADIIAGAFTANYGQSGEGAAYIYHGSSGMLDINPVKTLEGNQIDASFGFSVASAGDVNGDGFGDVIVGAHHFDNNESNEGAATVYYGTIGGINDVSPAPTQLEANVASAYFGSSVSSAGDVNGDGYSDLLVGAPNFSNGQTNEGKAFVYHGSPDGAKKSSSFSVESDSDNKFMGKSVSGAGDVNGDGYSDIVVGEIGYDNGPTPDAGAALIYYGNNGKGLKNNVRLFNGDLVTPLNHNQFNQPNFVATLATKSFVGRNKGKFVWETMGPGIPFSKTGNNPITTSNLFTGAAASFTTTTGLSTVMGGLIAKNGIATKVRVRVRYSPVLAITGQMYGPWRYLQGQLSGYNNAPAPENAMAETIKTKASGIDKEEPEISVFAYPNPVSDKLFIKAENMNQIRSVRLLTPTGKLVNQSQNPVTEIDVRGLAPGMYVLLVTRQDGTQSSHKVIVKK